MIDFLMPSLGADMDEAMLVGWSVKAGDRVVRGQVVAEVETDKGILEVECWHDGVVGRLLVQPGPDRLAVGTHLATIEEQHEIGAEPASSVTSPEAGLVPPTERESVAVGSHAQPPLPTPPIRHLAQRLGVDLDALKPTGPNGVVTRDDIRLAARPVSQRRRISPRARRMASDAGVDLSAVRPSGPDGMIVTADLPSPAQARQVPRSVSTADVKATDVKTDSMREAIARLMARSKREIPHYYLSTQIDMRNAMEWLDRRNADSPLAKRLLPAVLVAKATALAIAEIPELNGHWIDDGFRPVERVHLGVAISLRAGGLVAPAIHDAHALDVDELMAAMRDVVSRARHGGLRSSEMTDATATLTNLGDRGVDKAFPIIIPPQVAMVGFGKIVDRPIAIAGLVGVHPVVEATLAADHRASDGHRGGLFLSVLDRLLQEPDRL